MFFRADDWNTLQRPSQPPDLNLIEHAFHSLKTELKTERPGNIQQQKTTAVAWQSITKEVTQRLVISIGSRLQAVIPAKDSQLGIKNEHFIYDYIHFSNYFRSLEMTMYEYFYNS